MSCLELTNPQSASNQTFTDCVINEKNFENNTYTSCVFKNIRFNGCLFKNVKFIDCAFDYVHLDNCKSSSMVLNESIFKNSMIRKSKLNLTSISKTDFTNFRFYNSIFLGTQFENCNLTTSILENSSFVRTSMINVIFTALSMIAVDFRNSSFHELYFESDVDIQESNFNNCKFDDCHLGSPHITDTIFDDSHFNSVLYTDSSKIINCSLKNVTYANTKIITPTEIQNRRIFEQWLPVVLDMSGVVSERPQILRTRSRFLPLISRAYSNLLGEGDITHIPKPEPPIQYITNQRMHRHRPLLSRTAQSIQSTLSSLPSLNSFAPPSIVEEPFSIARRIERDAELTASIASYVTESQNLLRLRQQMGPESTQDVEDEYSRQMSGQDGRTRIERHIEYHREDVRDHVSQQVKKVERLRRHLQNLNVKLGITSADISASQKAYEVIDGEVSLHEHLIANADTIAFLFGASYYITTQENLMRMTALLTVEEQMDNSIVFECLAANTMRPDNIVVDKPLVKLASLGLPVNGAYLPLAQLLTIMADERKDINYRVYQLVDTKVVLNSVASYQVLAELTSYVGASHCQSGQGGRLYELRKMRNFNKVLSNLVSNYKTKKNKNTAKNKTLKGGKKTRGQKPNSRKKSSSKNHKKTTTKRHKQI